MSIFSSLRNKQGRSAGDERPEATLSDDLTGRFADLGEREAIASLTDFNQAELTEIHAFETSHRERAPVLDKLRYLREREPLADYDSLDADAVKSALSDADAGTIKAVREYERKHQNRPSVNNAIIGALRESRKREPASAAGSIAPLLEGAQSEGAQAPVTGNGLPIKVRPESGIGTP